MFYPFFYFSEDEIMNLTHPKFAMVICAIVVFLLALIAVGVFICLYLKFVRGAKAARSQWNQQRKKWMPIRYIDVIYLKISLPLLINLIILSARGGGGG